MAIIMVRIVAPTFIKGIGVQPGEVIELDAAVAQLLISNSKAEKFTPPPPAGPTPEEMAAAGAAAIVQAKVELLEKIATAVDYAELEILLSEDPEIIAAYEKRAQELDDAAAKGAEPGELQT